MACADHGDASGLDQIPPPPKVKQLNRMLRVPQLRGVLGRAVDADADPLRATGAKQGESLFPNRDGLSPGNQVRRP
jgi:hypothetical protein